MCPHTIKPQCEAVNRDTQTPRCEIVNRDTQTPLIAVGTHVRETQTESSVVIIETKPPFEVINRET